MAQELPNADLVCLDLRDLWKKFEEISADGIVTMQERAGMRLSFRMVQRRAKKGAVMQKVGFRLARVANCDKNLITELRQLCAELDSDCEEDIKIASLGGHRIEALDAA